jgi:hypothetical protein
VPNFYSGHGDHEIKIYHHIEPVQESQGPLPGSSIRRIILAQGFDTAQEAFTEQFDT